MPTPTAETMRIGWRTIFRVHGVTVDEGGRQVTFRDTTYPGAGEIEVMASFLPQPINIGPRLLPVRFVPEGGEPPTPPTEAADTIQFAVPGCWLDVMASTTVLAQVGSPYENIDEFVRATLEAHREILDDAVRPAAELAAGAWSVLIGDAVAEPWSSYRFVLLPDGRMAARSVTVFETIPVVTPDFQQMEDAGRVSFVLTGMSMRQKRILRNALTWYFRGRHEPARSHDRFTYLFLSLESLVALADERPEPSVSSNLSALAELAEDNKPLREFVQKIRERLARPPLSTRFDRLARQLIPAEASHDFAIFDLLSQLRNRLLHGSYTDVPTHYKELHVDDAIETIARKYLVAVMHDADHQLAANVQLQSDV